MACTVRNKGYQIQRISFGITKQTVNRCYYDLYQVYVFPLIETADIIGLSYLSTMKNQVNGPGMILYVEPVADIFTFTNTGSGFPLRMLLMNSGISFSGNWYGP